MLALIAESTGYEVSVTIIVQGTPITGFITPTSRYYEHLARMLAVQAELGGTEYDPSTEPPTTQEREQIHDRFAEAHAVSHDDEYTFPQICLRGATIRSGSQWIAPAYLLINADHVGAVSIGI